MRKIIVLAAAAAVAALKFRSRRDDEDVWHQATRSVDLR